MKIRMNRPIYLCAMILASAAALGAQQANQASPYEGTSTPPTNDEIITSTTPEAKPPAGKPATSKPGSDNPNAKKPKGDQPETKGSEAKTLDKNKDGEQQAGSPPKTATPRAHEA